jgi:hypothetical protein
MSRQDTERLLRMERAALRRAAERARLALLDNDPRDTAAFFAAVERAILGGDK